MFVDIKTLRKKMKNNILHVFGQLTWHSNVIIAGDIIALMNLKKAIEQAIADDSEEVEAFVNDGESYAIKILCIETKDLPILPLPYTDEIAKAGSMEWDKFLSKFRNLYF